MCYFPRKRMRKLKNQNVLKQFSFSEYTDYTLQKQIMKYNQYRFQKKKKLFYIHINRKWFIYVLDSDVKNHQKYTELRYYMYYGEENTEIAPTVHKTQK